MARDAWRILRMALCTLATVACGTTNLARPLDAGMTRASFSVGGPAVQGVPLPSPITTLGAAHGITDRIAVHGDLHPTAAALGLAGIDGGFAVHPVGPRALLGLGATAYGFANHADRLMLADGWISSGGYVGEYFFLAGGAHLAARVASSSPEVNGQQRFIPMIFALVGFRPGGQVEIQVEPRWYAFTSCGTCSILGFISPGGRGDFGLLFGATYEFGKGIR